MRYKVSLHRSEEGIAASVLGLPGCHSQGATEAEAMDNVRIAIQEYLQVQAELWNDRSDVREIELEA
ncbi:MAG: type II toxin-antitoxin system HicB family antitoxin [Planctomycetota bacterium]